MAKRDSPSPTLDSPMDTPPREAKRARISARANRMDSTYWAMLRRKDIVALSICNETQLFVAHMRDWLEVVNSRLPDGGWSGHSLPGTVDPVIRLIMFLKAAWEFLVCTFPPAATGQAFSTRPPDPPAAPVDMMLEVHAALRNIVRGLYMQHDAHAAKKPLAIPAYEPYPKTLQWLHTAAQSVNPYFVGKLATVVQCGMVNMVAAGPLLSGRRAPIPEVLAGAIDKIKAHGVAFHDSVRKCVALHTVAEYMEYMDPSERGKVDTEEVWAKARKVVWDEANDDKAMAYTLNKLLPPTMACVLSMPELLDRNLDQNSENYRHMTLELKNAWVHWLLLKTPIIKCCGLDKPSYSDMRQTCLQFRIFTEQHMALYSPTYSRLWQAMPRSH